MVDLKLAAWNTFVQTVLKWEPDLRVMYQRINDFCHLLA